MHLAVIGFLVAVDKLVAASLPYVLYYFSGQSLFEQDFRAWKFDQEKLRVL